MFVCVCVCVGERERECVWGNYQPVTLHKNIKTLPLSRQPIRQWVKDENGCRLRSWRLPLKSSYLYFCVSVSVSVCVCVTVVAAVTYWCQAPGEIPLLASHSWSDRCNVWKSHRWDYTEPLVIKWKQLEIPISRRFCNAGQLLQVLA